MYDIICGKNTFQLMWNTNGIIVNVFSNSFLITFQYRGWHLIFIKDIRALRSAHLLPHLISPLWISSQKIKKSIFNILYRPTIGTLWWITIFEEDYIAILPMTSPIFYLSEFLFLILSTIVAESGGCTTPCPTHTMYTLS